MTYVSANRNKAADLKIASGVYGLTVRISALFERFADYRAYRKTVNALSELSDYELSDLGLHRSGIQATANEAVYGSYK